MKLSRRDFMKTVGAAAAASASLALPNGSEAATVQPQPAELPAKPVKGKAPNILIILCDEMRFPPPYESQATKDYRDANLKFQNKLRENGLEFKRHYIMSAACVPSRASLLTGHYPSLHGTSQTVGRAKEPWDPDAFWLGPHSVPTLGKYFRAAGYLTFWVGKWHVSDADLYVPGTHTPLASFEADGQRDPDKEALYKAANQLDPYGFAGWIGPEPHGGDPIKDSGSSVPSVKPGQPIDYRGRDVSFAEQAQELIRELDRHPNSAPWLAVCSFTNPHDICMFGMFAQHDPRVEFKIDADVPSGDPQDDNFLFTWEDSGQTFKQTFLEDLDLSNKPTAQKSYRNTFHIWMQPIDDNPAYRQYYYQLHKNVDQEMMKVFNALQNSRYKDNTIVVFASDHGDLLGAHGDMHQKFYQAYEETVRVPLIIWSPQLFAGPGQVEALTSHADIMPTLLGLAGIDPGPIREQLAVLHSDAVPFVGRDLSPLILGQVDPASVNDPVYFMTDDDVSRGLNIDRRMRFGADYNPVDEPNSIETVIAHLEDGHLWKYSRYFDNPQYWSSPGNPNDPEEKGVQDVLRVQAGPNPPPDSMTTEVPFNLTVKATPRPDEFEMYDLDADPLELKNLYGDADYSAKQSALAQLLEQQRALKRLRPVSGAVPGQPVS